MHTEARGCLNNTPCAGNNCANVTKTACMDKTCNEDATSKGLTLAKALLPGGSLSPVVEKQSKSSYVMFPNADKSFQRRLSNVSRSNVCVPRTTRWGRRQIVLIPLLTSNRLIIVNDKMKLDNQRPLGGNAAKHDTQCHLTQRCPHLIKTILRVPVCWLTT